MSFLRRGSSRSSLLDEKLFFYLGTFPPRNSRRKNRPQTLCAEAHQSRGSCSRGRRRKRLGGLGVPSVGCLSAMMIDLCSRSEELCVGKGDVRPCYSWVCWYF